MTLSDEEYDAIWHCPDCGQHLKTFLPVPGHLPRDDVWGTCYADGEPWPCTMTILGHNKQHGESDDR